MSVEYEAHTTASSSLTVDRPGTAPECDGKAIVLVAFTFDTFESVLTPPAGFTSLQRSVESFVSTWTLVEIFAKLGGAAEPATYTVTASPNPGFKSLAALRLGGADPSDIFDVASSAQGADGVLTVTWPGVTVARDGSLAIAAMQGQFDDAATPAGFTSRVDALDGFSDVSTKAINAGATGAITAAITGGDWASALVIIQPLNVDVSLRLPLRAAIASTATKAEVAGTGTAAVIASTRTTAHIGEP